jgi:RNA-binding protein YhbY
MNKIFKLIIPVILMQSCFSPRMIEKKCYQFLDKCFHCTCEELNVHYTENAFISYEEPFYLLNKAKSDMNIDSSLKLVLLTNIEIDLKRKEIIKVDIYETHRKKIPNKLANAIENKLYKSFKFDIYKTFNSKLKQVNGKELPCHLVFDIGLKKGKFY